MTVKTIKPSLYYFLTEGIRGVWDRIKSWRYRHNYKKLQQGDGHPVLVIPGLLSNDLATKPLRTLLDKLGYAVYGWELGINLANLDDVLTLDQTLKRIHQEHQRPVTIIGWSLGGLYTRKIARDNPSLVRQIITLGSPFRSLVVPGAAMTTLKLLYRANEIPIPPEHKAWVEKIKEPLSIKTTCLYSKRDGIVPWTLCLESIEDDLHQNIEIKSSHTGMASNLDAIKIIVKQLLYVG